MRPENEHELAAFIASANNPIRIQGGGTRPLGNPCTGEFLSTTGLTGIREYEPGALTLVVGAGTPLDEVNTVLREHGQFLPFEPMDCRKLLGTKGVSTVGGLVSANSSGPRRVLCGGCRDYVIGIRFVSGEGEFLTAGGRVMKNVTGYDISKLFVGGLGTVGILTEICFKVLPIPHDTAVLLINGLSDDQAIRAMIHALNSPFGVSGAAHLPRGMDGHPVTMIRLEGFEVSIDYRTRELTRRLAKFGDVVVERDPVRTQAGWQFVRDVELFEAAKGGDVWRVSTRSRDAAALVDMVRRSYEIDVVYDCGGAVLWIRTRESIDLRALIGPLPGHATLIRTSDANKRRYGVFHPQDAILARLSEAVRQEFDPRNLLNRGIMDCRHQVN